MYQHKQNLGITNWPTLIGSRIYVHNIRIKWTSRKHYLKIRHKRFKINTVIISYSIIQYTLYSNDYYLAEFNM